VIPADPENDSIYKKDYARPKWHAIDQKGFMFRDYVHIFS
jgi:hypothetical protein